MKSNAIKTVFLVALLLGLPGSMFAQPAPTDAPVGEETVLGLARADYLETQQQLLEAMEDPAVLALTAQIERLIERRDKLMFSKAKTKHPSKVASIAVIENEVEKRRGPKPPAEPKPGT